MSATSANVQKFIQIGSGVSVLRMHDFAPLGTKWLRYLFIWERLQQNTTHDAVPRKEVTFWGFYPHFPKNRHFWASFRRDFNIGRLESKRPLIVVVAQ